MITFKNKVVLYVGANNKTGLVDKTTLTRIIGGLFEGFTIANTEGYWQGNPEASVTVTIFTEEERHIIDTMTHELIKDLEQYSILVEFNNEAYLLEKA